MLAAPLAHDRECFQLLRRFGDEEIMKPGYRPALKLAKIDEPSCVKIQKPPVRHEYERYGEREPTAAQVRPCVEKVAKAEKA